VGRNTSESSTTLQDRIIADLASQPAGSGPAYLRLSHTMRGLIETGDLRGGTALPSERELAVSTGYSRVTVRKAFDMLCDDGLISRKPGAGSFVSRHIDQPLSVLVGFTEDMKRRGADSTSRILEKRIALPNPSEMLKLGLSPKDRVFHLSRVRMASGEPLAIENATVPAFAVDIDQVGDSLYAALRASGNMPVRALQRLHASIATSDEAKLLGFDPKSPILRIERRSFLANGRPIEVTTSAYRGDRYDFIAELEIAP